MNDDLPIAIVVRPADQSREARRRHVAVA